MKQFNTYINSSFNKFYLKVEVLNEELLEKLKSYLEDHLPIVKNVNITSNQAKTLKTLTIYPKSICTINELKIEVDNSLERYFSNEKSDFRKKGYAGLANFLAKYPDVYSSYQSAREKYERGIYDRNTLDDMRLSLEQLLKSILKNDKPLEKQEIPLAQYLESHGTAKEICNMFHTVLNLLAKYQNNHVKHKEDIAKNDMQTIINQTLLIMERLQQEEAKI